MENRSNEGELEREAEIETSRKYDVNKASSTLGKTLISGILAGGAFTTFGYLTEHSVLEGFGMGMIGMSGLVGYVLSTRK